VDGRSEIYRQRTLEKFCHRGVQRPSLPLLFDGEKKGGAVSWVLRRGKEAI